jgi:hypothetical protein
MRTFKIPNLSKFKQFYLTKHLIPIVYRMIIFFLHQFSPNGRAGDFHMLRY